MKTSTFSRNRPIGNSRQVRRMFAALAVAAVMVAGAKAGASTPPGRVVDWGYSGFGSPTNPISILSDVVAVGAGSLNGLALRTDGSVVGASTLTVPPRVPAWLSNVVAISCGGLDGIDHNLALKSDGRVVAWGRNSYGQTNVPVWLSNVVAV